MRVSRSQPVQGTAPGTRWALSEHLLPGRAEGVAGRGAEGFLERAFDSTFSCVSGSAAREGKAEAGPGPELASA